MAIRYSYTPFQIDQDKLHGTSQSVRKDGERGGGELILPFTSSTAPRKMPGLSDSATFSPMDAVSSFVLDIQSELE